MKYNLGKFLAIAENTFAVIGLTFFTRAFDVGRIDDGAGLLSETLVSIIRYSVWLISILLILWRWKKSLMVVKRDIFIWILIGILLTSDIWSVFPEFTNKNMQEVWQMASFGLYFAVSFSIKEQLKLVGITCALGAFSSMYVVLRIPAIGKHWYDHPGAWRGVYDYKNTFGSMMVLSALAFFLLPIDAKKKSHRLYKWGFFIASLIFILLSTSKTSLVISFIIISTLFFYRNFRWRGKVSVFYLDIGVLILGCIGTLGLTQWVAILTGLGKDITLTGRLPMWGFILARLNERPWLGFGRGAFWAKGSKYAIAAGQAVSEGYTPPHAHNGYIDLSLDAGFIGLLLFIISFLIAYYRSLKLAYKSKNPEDYWPLAVLLFLTMNNMMESYLMRLANIYLVLYIATVLSVRPQRQNIKCQSG